MCRLFFHALIVLAAFNAVPVSKAAARPDATENPNFLWIVTKDIACDMGCSDANSPWEKPSVAFFHLGNTQKRRGSSGCHSPHPTAADFVHSLLASLPEWQRLSCRGSEKLHLIGIFGAVLIEVFQYRNRHEPRLTEEQLGGQVSLTNLEQNPVPTLR